MGSMMVVFKFCKRIFQGAGVLEISPFWESTFAKKLQDSREVLRQAPIIGVSFITTVKLGDIFRRNGRERNVDKAIGSGGSHLFEG